MSFVFRTQQVLTSFFFDRRLINSVISDLERPLGRLSIVIISLILKLANVSFVERVLVLLSLSDFPQV